MAENVKLKTEIGGKGRFLGVNFVNFDLSGSLFLPLK